jgi:hypothetical protein
MNKFNPTTLSANVSIEAFDDTLTMHTEFDSISKQYTTQVINTQEQAIKQGLQKLGWYSPEQVRALLHAANDVVAFRKGTTYYKESEKVIRDMFNEYFGRNE